MTGPEFQSDAYFCGAEGLRGQVPAVLGIGDGVGGCEVEQDHGALLAHPFIELSFCVCSSGELMVVLSVLCAMVGAWRR